MKKGTKEADQLIDKYLAGQCSPEEAALIETWFNEQSNRLVTELPVKPRHVKVPPIWITIAAASIIIICTIAYLMQDHGTANRAGPELRTTDVTTPAPNHPTLTLADGTVIPLNKTHAGIVVKEGHVYYDNGSTIKQTGIHSSERMDLHGKTLQLSTPRGAQYQVMLSDSTRIWLNAASTLKYPAHFTGDTRTVTLEGEAYFEVHPSAEPFIIQTASQEAVVLGTSFNISAYREDAAVKTTLLTGALQVRQIGIPSGRDLILAPNEQSINTGNVLVKSQVDVSSAIAWKNGRFSFEGKTFRQIMAEMTRWYDLEVIYEGDVPDEQFIGGTFRDQDITIVSSFLESAGVKHHMPTEKTIVIHHYVRQPASNQ